jgi:hypothetical protein
MIRIINPLLHTKYVDSNCIRSVFLWWTPQPCAEKWKTFLQFGSWTQTKNGSGLSYDQIWKYQSFHIAHSDLVSIIKQMSWSGRRLESSVLQYHIVPTPRPNVQSMGLAPPSVNAAFTALNGLLPKKPL